MITLKKHTGNQYEGITNVLELTDLSLINKGHIVRDTNSHSYIYVENDENAIDVEYICENVGSLTIYGGISTAHGFICFGSYTPNISISGFTASAGDDITAAASHEVWEFSCANGFIIWKNWGEFGE